MALVDFSHRKSLDSIIQRFPEMHSRTVAFIIATVEPYPQPFLKAGIE